MTVVVHVRSLAESRGQLLRALCLKANDQKEDTWLEMRIETACLKRESTSENGLVS